MYHFCQPIIKPVVNNGRMKIEFIVQSNPSLCFPSELWSSYLSAKNPETVAVVINCHAEW